MNWRSELTIDPTSQVFEAEGELNPISQVFEAEGELDSHSLAGKKRVDQATTEAEDRSQDG